MTERAPAAAPVSRGTRAAALVSRLTRKYTELLALRDAQSAGDDPPALRERLRDLAELAPGALGELDRLPRETIVARLAELAAVEGDTTLAPWMIAVDRYHRWLRVGLRGRGGLVREAGRLVPAVVARVARELDRSPSEIEAWLDLPPGRAPTPA
ncbi:MAG: hypothetical protein K1X94_14005 [Sandaracinaceae bacterium]|nr:hypothetical protein [Sandaracinaceae bacterium]